MCILSFRKEISKYLSKKFRECGPWPNHVCVIVAFVHKVLAKSDPNGSVVNVALCNSVVKGWYEVTRSLFA